MRLRQELIAVVAIAAMLILMWGLTLSRVGAPTAETGTPFVSAVMDVPPISADTPDVALYFHIISRVQAGANYYDAAKDVLLRNNATEGGSASSGVVQGVDLSSPASYRLPTMYWLLAQLPPSGYSYVIAALVAGSIAVAGAYVLVQRFVYWPAAVASSALVASLYSGLASSILMFGSEVWAGALGLLAVALLVSVRGSAGHIPALMWASAAAALAAASVREIAVAFVLVGLAATLADGKARRARLWLPWAVALGAFALLYVAHSAAVQPYLVPSPVLTGFHWLAADGRGLVAGVARSSANSLIPAAGVWLLLLSAMVGSLVASTTIMYRVALATTTIGGAVMLALFRPPGSGIYGGVPSYWADLVMPAILACAPLLLAAVPSMRARRTSRTADAGRVGRV